jgi:hypothetical protein
MLGGDDNSDELKQKAKSQSNDREQDIVSFLLKTLLCVVTAKIR